MFPRHGRPNRPRQPNRLRPGILDVRPGILDVRPGILDLRPGILDVRPGILDLRPGILDLPHSRRFLSTRPTLGCSPRPAGGTVLR
ncbi:MAG TPA: hypothetical protein VG147_12585 [Solirubrobacteraceae bacterium]|nr:hypothetical protein [Solirubrobacteraceae bacterium]